MNETPRLLWYRYWLAMGWLLVALVIWVSLTPKPPQPPDIPYADKIGHLVAYGILMGWFGQLYVTAKQRMKWVVGLIAMGVALEIAQGISGARWFEWADALANSLGVVVAWAVVHWGVDGIFVAIEKRMGGRR